MSVLVTPSLATLTSGETQTFVASGGSSPYVYSFLSNNSGGTINASTGFYTAGASGGVLDVILVTDSLEALGSAAVSVLGISVFQGIGLLKQISYIPAPTLSDIGFVLTTPDGIAIEWLAAPTGIPDQATFGGDFLTTDGTTASWAPIPPGLPDQSGHTGGFLSTDGTNPFWTPVPPVATSNIHDIRLFGAVSDPTGVFDSTDAVYATIAAWTQSPNYPAVNGHNVADKVGAIYGTEGIWNISMPIMIPGGCEFFGDSWQQTLFVVGNGTPNTPSICQGFGGPMFYLGGPYTAANLPSSNFPTYAASLLTGSGQSLVCNDTTAPTLWLHDAWPWGQFLGVHGQPQQLSLQCQVIPNDTLDGSHPVYKAIIGSRGPDVLTTTDICIGLYFVSDDGITGHFRAYLTTGDWPTASFLIPKSGTQQIINSSNVTLGTSYNLEIDYNGSFFDFYLGGVNQGHLTATGAIIRAPWEGCSIGAAGSEYQNDLGNNNSNNATTTVKSFIGKLDSVRLSSVARHTGAGSFTPPTAKYAWDASTLWLANFDQAVPTQPGDATLTLPFFVAQTAILTAAPTSIPNASPTFDGPCKHYIRLTPDVNGENLNIHDLQVVCNYNTSGIIDWASPITIFQQVAVTLPLQFGIKLDNPGSFYTYLEDCFVFWAMGTGYTTSGILNRLYAAACGIGLWMVQGGRCDTFHYQPSWNNYISIFVGPGSGGTSSWMLANTDNDTEVWDFVRQVTPVLVWGGAGGSFVSTNNLYQAGLSDNPCIIFVGGVPESGFATFINDSFFPDPSSPCYISNYNNYPGAVMLQNCGYFGDAGIPICDTPGFVTQFDSKGITNQSGLSATNQQSTNLVGRFNILHGFTSGGVTFTTPMPSEKYEVYVQYQSYSGSAPAAGSTVEGRIVTTKSGFQMLDMVDPASTSQTTWSYLVVGSHGNPLYYSYIPSIPSSFANPLVTVSPTGDWTIGVTFLPTPPPTVPLQGITPQIILQMGTTTANWWALGLNNESQLYFEIGSSGANAFGAIVGPRLYNKVNGPGMLANFQNPGPHNIALGVINNVFQWYIDGVLYQEGAQGQFGPGFSVGTQQTPIYVGQLHDGSLGLTLGTLRNLKVDTIFSQVITTEQDVGPAAKQQNAFFGDQWTGGYSSVSAPGWAQQIANLQFATAFWWFAEDYQAAMGITNEPPMSIGNQYWALWGAQYVANFESISLMGGWVDIGTYGTSAAVTFADITGVLTGIAGTDTLAPPTTNEFAFAEFVPPSPGSSTCVINGVTFTATFVTNLTTTVNNLITAVNSSAPTTALVTPSFYSGPNSGFLPIMIVTAVTPGTAGNGITCTTNGANGSFWYTGFPSTGTTFGAVDNQITINGTEFIGNFVTNAATTVNNMVSAIMASGPISALVTPSNVANQLKLVAVTPGFAGNSITVLPNGRPAPPSGWYSTGVDNEGNPLTSLVGGVDGSVGVVPHIVLCTVPPLGAYYSAPKETQRQTLNTSIRAFTGAGVVLADVDVTLRDPSNHANMLPLFTTDATYPNDLGHTALFILLQPLLTGIGTPPSALSYATNPASYAHGGPIASNNPTVTGTPTGYVVSPPLPAGLVINSSTGHITGTPTSVTASATYNVMAYNAAGGTSVALVIAIT